MRKKRFAVSIIAVVIFLQFSWCCGTNEPKNTVASTTEIASVPSNGGFESWSGTPYLPDGWSIVEIGPIYDTNAIHKSTISYGGSYALRLGGETPSEIGYDLSVVMAQDVPVWVGATYSLSYYGFGENPWGTLTAGVGVDWLDASKSLISHAITRVSLPDGGIMSYTSFSGDSGPAPAGAVYARIYVEKMSWGFTNFDDVDFIPLAMSPRRAFFGWYEASQMPPTGWVLLQRTIDWATGGTNPANTTIALFSYYGWPFHNDNYDKDAFAVYNQLLYWGYTPINILVCGVGEASTQPPSFYYGYHLAVYWDADLVGYDATGIVASSIPFISVQATQTDEMGIGTGVRMCRASHDNFSVVGMAYPTRLYPTGLLSFESGVYFDAMELASGGNPLVVSEGRSVLVTTPGPLTVKTNRMFYKLGQRVSIYLSNVGTEAVAFPYYDGKVRIVDTEGRLVWPHYVTDMGEHLNPGETETIPWNQVGGLMYSPVDYGEYIVETQSELSPQHEAVARFFIRNIGYFILVAGSYEMHSQSWIERGVETVYGDLVGLGYDPDRIQYLSAYSDHPGVDAESNRNNFFDAIDSWARDRVGPTEPLFIYLFDHGGVDMFGIDNPTDGWDQRIYPSEMENSLSNLEGATRASIYVIYSACHSGSFIDELSRYGRVIITAAEEDETGSITDSPYSEFFAERFWPGIVEGKSLLAAFNSALQADGTVPGQDYHPLLDDNGNRVGSRGPLEAYFFPLDEGFTAAKVYISSTKWIFPWIRYVIPKQSYAWPPPETITLWAKVENRTPIANVRALMLPPDWSPPPPDFVLVETPFECFEMTDSDNDGNWTVTIPSVNFTDHATGPSIFRFKIAVQEVGNNTAIPRWTSVEFTETGVPSPDTMSPSVNIVRPISDQIVQGTVVINGTVTDDTCLQKIEIYRDTTLLGIINPPPTSHSYFEINFDTETVSNGLKTIQVKAFDTSNNVGTETMEVVVTNPTHNIAIRNVAPSKTVIGEEYSLSISVTMENEDIQPQVFNVTVYANATAVETKTITLPSSIPATIVFTWNTTGFAKGNYIISGYAWPVQDEGEIADNILTTDLVKVTIPGDINGDQYVNAKDAIALGMAFYPSGEYNPNADLNGDGYCNAKDAVILGNHFNEHWE